ncbi:MAG: beta-galactosidase [Lentisphaerae bacterium]|nr:beta-galactosidase [Lentisphaerota bacterium]
MSSELRPTIISGFNHILHGGDYNPDQWQKTPEVVDEDFRLIKLAGCNAFSVGIFAWTSLEPEEGRFTFGWLDRVMDGMARDGHKVILATPSGSKPAWMSLKYPEIRRVNSQGLRDVHRNRHNHCWSSPVYREKVRIMNTQLAERYGKHPALAMWHISNEMNGECHCELCLKWWREWLQQTYGTLDALNAAWWTAFWSHTFTAWDQIEPRDSSLDGMRVAWLRFINHQLRDFYQWEAKPLRAASAGIPITTNFMGLFSHVDYSKLAEIVDVVADDQYPAYSASDPNLPRSAAGISFKDNLYRCFKPDRPWMLMESCTGTPQWRQPTRLKRPGLHQAEMLQALGHGAEGTCYFQWRKCRGSVEKFHGAVVDHVGHEHTREFRGVADLSRRYARMPEILGSTVRAEVAMLYDWESRWGIELSDGPGFTGEMYPDVMLDHYQPFWDQGLAVDVINSERDFSGYRVLIAPLLWMLKPQVAARVRTFVEAGGVFVTTFFSGICDQHNLCLTGGWPGDGLMDLCGIWNEETDVLGEGERRRVKVAGAWAGKKRSFSAAHVCAVAQLRGAKALAVYDEDFYKGLPVLTRHAVGKGQAYYVAARVEVDCLRAFYGKMARDLKLHRPVPAVLPQGVTVQERVKDRATYLFFQNFSTTAKRVALGPKAVYRRLLDDKRVRGTLTLPPLGSDVLARG